MRTMVVFIAGILTGWILEWLFFTFFVKKNEDVASASSIAQVTNQSVPLEKEQKIEEKKEANPPGETEKKATPALGDDTKNVSNSTKQANSKTEATPKTVVKTEAKEMVNKVSLKKPTSKKTAAKLTKQPTKTSSASTAKTTKSDDLTTLKGIGPKLAKSLSAIGINSFSELAKLQGDDIVKQLENAGHKVVNKAALGNLAPQAKLAAKGDLDGLKTLQKSL